MQLESIDQKTDRLLYHLWHLSMRFEALLSSGCKQECDLSIQEIKAVGFLGRVGPMKMKGLADYLKLAVSSTTSLVDNLESKGVVRRERSFEDRRVIILRLTESGLHHFQLTLQIYHQFCHSILEMLGAEDGDRFLALLDKISGANAEL